MESIHPAILVSSRRNRARERIPLRGEGKGITVDTVGRSIRRIVRLVKIAAKSVKERARFLAKLRPNFFVGRRKRNDEVAEIRGGETVAASKTERERERGGEEGEGRGEG